jgi:DNA repair exonuclease SbcCD ATPase subunit
MSIRKLKAVSLAGFRAFAEERHVDLSADAVLVLGPNGRGKTSLLDGLLWALTDRIPRFGDAQHVVSLYSETGKATVALQFETDLGEECSLRRTTDGKTSRLTLKRKDVEVQGKAAEAALEELLNWSPSGGGDSEIGLADALTRIVYLQQDRIREFLEADSDDRRFMAVSQVLGMGRVSELQLQLDRERRAWAQATTRHREEMAALAVQVDTVKEQLVRLTTSSSGFDSEQMATKWSNWWQRAFELGIQSKPVPDHTSPDAVVTLESALKELSAIKAAHSRSLAIGESVQIRLSEMMAAPPNPVEEHKERARLAQVEVATARARLTEVKRRVNEENTSLLTAKTSSEQLGAMATIALRHLGDRCPVCTQPYDRPVTEQHLGELIEQSGVEREIGLSTQHDLQEALRLVQDADRQFDESNRAVLEAERSAEAAEIRKVELGRQFRDLDIDAAVDREAVVIVERRLATLREVVERLSNHQSTGEELALSLVRQSELTRRASLEGELERLAPELKLKTETASSYQAASRMASDLFAALDGIAIEGLDTQVRGLTPMLQRVYAGIAPHPAFRDVALIVRSYYGRGRLLATIRDPVSNQTSESPEMILSSSQLSALVLSIVLSMNFGVPRLPLQAVILDDPFSNLDDVHLLGAVDLIRRSRGFRQLILSTHDSRVGRLLERKLRPVGAGQRTVVVDFSGWTRSGPNIEQRDIVGDEGGLRLVG